MLALDLGMHPLADTFLKKEQLEKQEERFPLQMLRCRACGHAMNSYIVPAEKRYQENEYSYDSSNSKVAVQHFEDLARDVIARSGVKKGDLVVDIGGNVGTLLQAFKTFGGAEVLNVEPAPNIADISEKCGIPTVRDFFNTKTAELIAAKGGAKAITSTNSFNHITDLDAFIKDIVRALRPDGMFIFEVPYLLPLIEKTAFDTIYLEHISYFAIKPLAAFFKKYGLVIADVQENDYMGGSFRVTVARQGESPKLQEWIEKEERAGLYSDETFHRFAQRVEEFRTSLRAELDAAKKAGGLLIGIGAATKGNTLLNYCGITSEQLAFITDASPLKIGKFTPGSRIPIQPDEAVTDQVTHALILPWNIGDMLRAKLAPKFPRITFIVPHAS